MDIVYYQKCHIFEKSYKDVKDRTRHSVFSTVKRKDALKKKLDMSIPVTQVDAFIGLANFHEPKPSSALNSFHLL